MKYLVYALLLCSLCNCAGVKIVGKESAKAEKENSFKVHLPKPFLLVERSPSKDVKIKTTVIYLPDFSTPYYIRPVRGIGSSEMTFNLEKGYLNQFGAITDSKTPELITAIGGVVTGGLPLLLDDPTEAAEGGEEGGDGSGYAQLKTSLENAKTDLEKNLGTALLSSEQKRLRETLLVSIGKGIDLANQASPSINDELIATLNRNITLVQQLIFKDVTSVQYEQHNDAYKQLKRDLVSARDAFSKPKVAPSSIELYEINYGDTGYTLKKVNW